MTNFVSEFEKESTRHWEGNKANKGIIPEGGRNRHVRYVFLNVVIRSIIRESGSLYIFMFPSGSIPVGNSNPFHFDCHTIMFIFMLYSCIRGVL